MANREKIIKYAAITLSGAFLIAAVVVGAVSCGKMQRTLIPPDETDRDYYSQTVRFDDEVEYSAYIAGKSDGDTIIAALPEDGEFVEAVSTTVWVADGRDWSGLNTVSWLLTEDEIEKFGENAFTFTIDLALGYSAKENRYYVAANADWQTPSGLELFKFQLPWDYMALTWGGNSNIVCGERYLSGKYGDGAPVHYPQWDANSYGGYIWWFYAYNEAGYIDNTALTTTLIPQRHSGGQTNIKLIYVHAYGSEYQAHPHLVYYGDSAADLSITDSTNYWQIEVELGGINY